MSDYFLSDLQQQTTDILDTDLFHIRTVGNIDYKVEGEQLQAYLKSPGHSRMSFSNLGTNLSEPKIQAGSEIAVQGATKELVQFVSETAGTGWAGITTDVVCYMKISPAGAVSYTETAPTWNVAKAGWYDANDRYVLELYKISGTEYGNKRLLQYEDLHIPKALQTVGRILNNLDSNLADVTMSGATITRRVMVCKNFRVTANSTLRCNVLICEGDFRVDSGVTLTIENPAVYNDENGSRDETAVRRSSWFLPGLGAVNDPYGGGGAFGGTEGPYRVGEGGGGGSSFAITGGGTGAITPYTGYPYDVSGIAFGGNGGRGGTVGGDESGGGGAGPCGGGGAGSSAAGVGGNGGAIFFLLVKGNFLNYGLIDNNGKDGGTITAGTGGGGGGGLFVLFAYGSNYINSGSGIICRGGNGGDGATGTNPDGGGGGGGHIELYVYLNGAAWGTRSASGGTSVGTGGAVAGAAGTVNSIDLSTGLHWRSLYGGYEGNVNVGLCLKFCPISLGV
jgi:hypothetical protein